MQPIDVVPEHFTGDLAEKIANFRRLEADRIRAMDRIEAVQRNLVSARHGDVQAAVEAKLRGDAPDDPQQLVAAEAERRSSEIDWESAKSAETLAAQAAGQEAQDPRYDATLAEQEAQPTQRALATIDELEQVVDALAYVKATRGWLQRPTAERDAEGNSTLAPIRVSEIWAHAKSVQHENGEPAGTRELTNPLREAIEGVRPKDAQTDEDFPWGIPSGQAMAGLGKDGVWGPIVPKPGSPAYAAAEEAGVVGAVPSRAGLDLFAEQLAEIPQNA